MFTGCFHDYLLARSQAMVLNTGCGIRSETYHFRWCKKILFFLIIILQIAALLTSAQNCPILCKTKCKHNIVSNKPKCESQNHCLTLRFRAGNISSAASERSQAVPLNHCCKATGQAPLWSWLQSKAQVNKPCGHYAARWPERKKMRNRGWVLAETPGGWKAAVHTGKTQPSHLVWWNCEVAKTRRSNCGCVCVCLSVCQCVCFISVHLGVVRFLCVSVMGTVCLLRSCLPILSQLKGNKAALTGPWTSSLSWEHVCTHTHARARTRTRTHTHTHTHGLTQGGW